MDRNQTIQQLASELLEKIGVQAKVQVEDSEEAVQVLIDTEDTALLIGKHGNTLVSYEYILSQMINTKLGEFVRIVVEVGGYRQEREEYLKGLADRLKDEVITSGGQRVLRGLKPWERRVVHLYLSEDGEIETESEGEGNERVLVLKKK